MVNKTQIENSLKELLTETNTDLIIEVGKEMNLTPEIIFEVLHQLLKKVSEIPEEKK